MTNVNKHTLDDDERRIEARRRPWLGMAEIPIARGKDEPTTLLALTDVALAGRYGGDERGGPVPQVTPNVKYPRASGPWNDPTVAAMAHVRDVTGRADGSIEEAEAAAAEEDRRE